MRSQRPEEERLEDEANLALRAELSLLRQATATIATCIGETGEHLKTLNGSRGDLVGALRELNASERLDVECLKMELPPEVEATTFPSGEGSGELSAAGRSMADSLRSTDAWQNRLRALADGAVDTVAGAAALRVRNTQVLEELGDYSNTESPIYKARNATSKALRKQIMWIQLRIRELDNSAVDHRALRDAERAAANLAREVAKKEKALEMYERRAALRAARPGHEQVWDAPQRTMQGVIEQLRGQVTDKSRELGDAKQAVARLRDQKQARGNECINKKAALELDNRAFHLAVVDYDEKGDIKDGGGDSDDDDAAAGGGGGKQKYLSGKEKLEKRKRDRSKRKTIWTLYDRKGVDHREERQKDPNYMGDSVGLGDQSRAHLVLESPIKAELRSSNKRGAAGYAAIDAITVESQMPKIQAKLEREKMSRPADAEGEGDPLPGAVE